MKSKINLPRAAVGLTAVILVSVALVRYWSSRAASANTVRELGARAVAFTPDGARAFASYRHSWRFYDAMTGVEVANYHCPVEPPGLSTVMLPDGRHAVSGSGRFTDRTYGIRLWDIATGKTLWRLIGHTTGVRSVAASRDGRYVVSCGGRQSIRLWDVKNIKAVREFAGHTGNVNSIAISNDGRYVLSGAGDYRGGQIHDPTVRLWDLHTGEHVKTFSDHEEPVYSVDFSPDDRFAVSGSWDSTIRVWDIDAGKAYRRIEWRQPGDRRVGSINRVAFSPNGRHVLSGDYVGGVMLWDVRTAKLVRRFVGHSTPILDLRFSPDGTRALTSAGELGGYNRRSGVCIDCTVRLWDVNTGKEIWNTMCDSDAVLAKPN